MLCRSLAPSPSGRGRGGEGLGGLAYPPEASHPNPLPEGEGTEGAFTAGHGLRHVDCTSHSAPPLALRCHAEGRTRVVHCLADHSPGGILRADP